MRDVRICFVGDSFVAGVGDPQSRGWVGRVAERTVPVLGGVTAYNLGVRRDTSIDVLARWADECARRLPDEVEGRVVVSFGVNDCAIENGRRRVEPAQSADNLDALVAQAADLPVLVVGPPPIADEEQNQRIAALDEALTAWCRDHQVPYMSVFGSLRDSGPWLAEVRAGDGSHPAGLGYDQLTDLVWAGGWTDWLEIA